MKLAPLFALLLACAPFAAAGGYDASVTWLEGDASCASDSGNRWTSNQTEWSSSTRYDSWWRDACQDDFTYGGASVRDDDGEVASASLGAGSGYNESSSHGYEAFSRHDGESWAWSSRNEYAFSNDSGFDRRARVDTREGSVDAAYACRDARSYSWNSSETGHAHAPSSASGRWTSSADEYQRAYGCGLSGSASHGNEEVSVQPLDEGCSQSARSQSQGHARAWGGNETVDQRSWREERDECHAKAGAAAGDAAASGGWVDRCEASEYQWSREETGRNATSYTYGSSACQRGILLEGPDGMALFVGSERHAWWDTCAEEPCAHGWAQAGARLTWAHNPLGPEPRGFFVPLP